MADIRVQAKAAVTALTIIDTDIFLLIVPAEEPSGNLH